MRFDVLDAADPADRAAWLERWHAWRGREVMAHPDYARLLARSCDRVVCAVGEEAAGAILLPLVLRPIATEPWARAADPRWDATTPYGYGGPFVTGPGPRDDAAFWGAHAGWCRAERVVATFMRLSLFPEQLAPLPAASEARLVNIVVPVAAGMDAVWRGYERKVRRWVARAEEAGLRVEVDPRGARVEAFAELYTETMRRRGADAWYFFPRSFFDALVDRLAGHVVFFHALLGDEVVSSDLVLCSAAHVYYFLGGTRAERFPLGPNYLIKHHVAAWAAAHGARAYVLGGGYAADDTLFRYKRAFARRGEVAFKVAQFVHDEAAIRELTAARGEFEARAGRAWAPRPGWFPPYRA